MRLINADKLENVDFSDCIDSMEIMNVIDEQPTAYDVDAVGYIHNKAGWKKCCAISDGYAYRERRWGRWQLNGFYSIRKWSGQF